mmetsp:Transcript_48017/g.102876  ORF Transcript_48017/g.102876 Transcript_48017/m.102876 type:complete len:226 (-) Transcript_48017:819-1496(-)
MYNVCMEIKTDPNLASNADFTSSSTSTVEDKYSVTCITKISAKTTRMNASISKHQKSETKEPTMDINMFRSSRKTRITRSTRKMRLRRRMRRDRRNPQFVAPLSLPYVSCCHTAQTKAWSQTDTTSSMISKIFHRVSWFQKKYMRWTHSFKRSSMPKRMQKPKSTDIENGVEASSRCRMFQSAIYTLKTAFAKITRPVVTSKEVRRMNFARQLSRTGSCTFMARM